MQVGSSFKGLRPSSCCLDSNTGVYTNRKITHPPRGNISRCAVGEGGGEENERKKGKMFAKSKKSGKSKNSNVPQKGGKYNFQNGGGGVVLGQRTEPHLPLCVLYVLIITNNLSSYIHPD
jgi:hypothetical protein